MSAFSRVTLTLLALSFALCLFAASPREQDDYAYIIELFDLGDYEEALDEMDYFIQSYPNSEFLPYLDYIKANIAMAQGQWQHAQGLYQPLLKMELHRDVKSDVLLNYAISLYSLGDARAAIAPLLELGLSTKHPYYVYQGNLWRGKCYQELGLLLSAEHEYQKALKQNAEDQELEYEYFKLLLQLQKEDSALEIMARNAQNPDYGKAYRLHWLQHLLYDQRFEEIDTFLASFEDEEELQSEAIRLVLIRKDMAIGDFQQAASSLESLAPSTHRTYYHALILAKEGNIARADSLFRDLLGSSDPEIQFLSYLEHLKIRYQKDPDSAIRLLKEYLQKPLPESYRGHQHLLLASFEYDAGRYQEAQKHWAEARRFDLPPELMDRVEIGTADTYYLMGEQSLAQENYNRYLNSYQNGRFRDRAFFRLGKIAFDAKNLEQARQNLEAMADRYPQSAFTDEAYYLLGETEYLSSRYEEAIARYQAIDQNHPSSRTVNLRLAQCYYYLDRFAESEQIVNKLDPSARDYEQVLLEAALAFHHREFEAALRLYASAWAMADNPSQKQESTSYQAYTLYYLKHFEDATRLFLELSDLNPDVDSYLYQAARSAYQGRAYQRALELYDRFVDDYPQSPHFQNVLGQIALCHYNLGNYEDSYQDWLNILRMFHSNTSFTESEVTLLRDVFNGIQLCLNSMEDLSPILELVDLPDTFQSEYIRFEISYLIVKLYASYGRWDDVLEEAEQIRQKYPQRKTPELDLLLAESLLKLNQQKEAEEIATQVFEETQSPESLLSLARLAESTGDLGIAQEKYQELFDLDHSSSNWLKLLDISLRNGHLNYDIIWDQGLDFAPFYPQARINRIQYLVSKGFYDEAMMMANQILDSETNQFIRAQADFELAMLYYQREDYKKATSSFKRIRVLYKDYPDILVNAHFHYILSLIHSGALKEAQLTLWEIQSQLTEDQVIIINDILDGQR